MWHVYVSLRLTCRNTVHDVCTCTLSKVTRISYCESGHVAKRMKPEVILPQDYDLDIGEGGGGGLAG